MIFWRWFQAWRHERQLRRILENPRMVAALINAYEDAQRLADLRERYESGKP